jgi:hypothetical protein
VVTDLSPSPPVKPNHSQASGLEGNEQPAAPQSWVSKEDSTSFTWATATVTPTGGAPRSTPTTCPPLNASLPPLPPPIE